MMMLLYSIYPRVPFLQQVITVFVRGVSGTSAAVFVIACLLIVLGLSTWAYDWFYRHYFTIITWTLVGIFILYIHAHTPVGIDFFGYL